MTKKTKPSSDPLADLEDDLKVPSSAEDLAAVEKVVIEALTLKQRIERGEELLKQLNADLNIINTKTLPDIMARANTSLFCVSSGPMEGYKVEIVPLIAGSLPKLTKNDNTPELIAAKKAQRERGLNFIREAGAEDIIKTVLTVEFDKGEDNLMGDLKGYVENLGLLSVIDSDVHHATLKSFANERLKKGEELPVEDLGLFIGRTAKLTEPKGK
jgi:hypothetical protein